jgi:hypothetical protein
MTTAERELRDALLEIAGPGKVGYPTVLEYYHDIDTCELPENCGHCVMVKRARALLERFDCANESVTNKL